MNKRNSRNFLSTIYGPNFDKWLPPASRISHHRWTKLDLGEYAYKNGLPEDYAYCMTNRYNPAKLLRMQELTVEMYAKVDEICSKHGLRYYILGNDGFAAANHLEDAAVYWKGPGIVAMPRADYERFGKVYKEELGPKYLFQSLETDSNYWDPIARLRCNGTHVREAHIPAFLQTPDSDGFFIRVIPMEHTSRFKFLRRIHRWTLHKLQVVIGKKHFYSSEQVEQRAIAKKGKKQALKIHAAGMISENNLKQMLKWVQNWFAKFQTGWFVTGRYYLAAIPEEILGEGSRIDFCGKSLVFPEDTKGYCKLITHHKKKGRMLEHLHMLAKLNRNCKAYQKSLKKMLDIACSDSLKILPLCNLDYLDVPEYQLSVCRYDEKTGKYLTNMELLGFE